MPKKSETISQEYAESIVNTVREPLLVLDHDLRVVTASRSFYDGFKVKPEETVGKLIYDLGNKQWNIPKLRELLETILPQKATFDDYEVDHDFAAIGRRTMLLNARRIPDPPKKLKVILLAIEDITGRRKTEESYLKLAAIVNTSVDGIIGKNLEGDIVSWNAGAEKIYGYTEKEIRGKNISLLAPAGYKEEMRSQIEKLRSGDAVKNHETKRVRKDGIIIDISLSLSPINDKSGTIYGVSAIMHDITEQKKATQILMVSEYSESIINTVREPLIVLDQDLRVVTVSRSFYDVFKVKPEETVGQLIYDLGNKQWDIPKLRELLEDILPKKAAFDNYEVEHIFSTIGRRVMLLNARQIERGKGKERIILLAIEDITERKEVESGLEKTRKELEVIKKSADEASEFAESVINTVREPLISLNQDLRVVTVSRSFYEFFKVKPEETVGKLIYDLGNEQWNIPKLRELLEDILPKKAAFDNYEVEHDFATIGRRVMLLNARQIERGKGKERIILLAIEDITERKEIEAGLEKTRKELEVIKKSADEASEYAESVINTVREPLIALDQDLRVVTVSRSFYEFFKVKPEETVGQLIYDLGNKQWNIPKLRELLETILPQEATFDNYEVEHDFATIGRRIMLLNARQIQRVLGKERIILLAIEDITGRKEIEAGLEKTRKELEVIKISADKTSEFAESLINTVREPLISLDQDLRVVTVSRSFYEFFKVKPEETVGQLIYDLGNKQWDIPKLRELLETILPLKATFENYEVEHNFATIGRRVMLLNARQIEQGKGKERIILLAIEDITERKEIEAGLEKTRKELEVIKKSADEVSEFAESLINTVREPLISLDQDLRVVAVSRSFYEYFKVKPEETMGQLIYDLGNKQWNIPKLRELLETILPQEATFDNYEVEHDFATIGRRIMLLNARQIQRVLGKERIILLAIEDITERRKLEEAHSKLAAIVESADDAIIDENLEGTVLSWNRGAEIVYGHHAGDMVGKSISLLMPASNLEDYKEVLAKIARGETIKHYETQRRRKDGQIIDVSLTMSPVKDISGKITSVSTISRDITERRVTENGLKKAHEELNELAAELKRTARVKSEFLANMSHELRTPLNSINGFSEVLFDETFGPLNEKQKKYANNILTSGKHLLLLINQILDMAKVEAGKMTLALSSLPMKSLLQELSLLVADLVSKKKLHMVLEISEDLPDIEADELKVKQILYNLLSNAVKFTPEGGEIGLRAKKAGSNIEVVVWDTGVGIAPENMEKVFEGFFRVDTPYSRVTEGTGLGLPLSKKLVELHGGQLFIESKGLDKGASIRFTLPVVSRQVV